MRKTLIWASALGMIVGAPALAAPAAPPRPPALQAVVDCRKVDDPQARLACYDSAVAQMTKAEEVGDLVAIDRAQRRAVRRQAFGFALPTLAIFDRGEKSEEINRLEDTIDVARRNGDGKWVIRTTGGAVWRQIDDNELPIEPRPGDRVLIKRFSLGSYMLDVAGQPGFRAHRDE